MKHTITFNIHKDDWLSANHRMHWAVKARKTRNLRGLAWGMCVKEGLDKALLGPTSLDIQVHRPRGGRADADNAAPTVKALIDGMVDACVWDDDDDEHIIAKQYRPGPPTGRPGQYAITITLTETTACP